VDTLIEFNEERQSIGPDGKPLITQHSSLITLIDTAGIRKRGTIEPGVEKYSVLRAFKAMERADVVVLLLDVKDGIIAQDEHIAGYIQDENKSAIVCVNKWDEVESPEKIERIAKHVEGYGYLTQKMTDFLQVVQGRLNFMPYMPTLFTSAKLGFRTNQVIPTALRAHESRSMRIPTSDVNRILREAMEKHAPPSKGGRFLKFYFGSQVGVNPPHFVFQVNDPKLVHFSYKRFLENRLREEYGFMGTPINISFKGRKDE
jgi:GTP-binding protein